MVEKSNPSSRERDRPTAQSATSEGADVSSAEGDDRPTSTPDEPDEASERTAAPADEGGAAGGGRDVTKRVKLRSSGSLERLRDRVDNAAHELKRLREENQALSERIKELESRPHVAPQGTFLSLDHDPEMLRRKISGFIEAIDRYLENERKRS